MEIINELIEKLGEKKISYSVGFYAIALMVSKKLLTTDEVVSFIDDVESNIADEYMTEMKSNEQLDTLKPLFSKKVKSIECVFADSIKEYCLGVVFEDETYVTLKSYVDEEKIKKEIEKVR